MSRAPTSGRLLVATGSEVLVVRPGECSVRRASGLDGQLPTCLAADPLRPGVAWCGAGSGGVFRSEDGGDTWRAAGLEGRDVTAVVPSPAAAGLVWAGTEPSEMWRLAPHDDAWERLPSLETLPSSSGWSFPPKPETHHVRWIACHPSDDGHLWVAVEAGALITTRDGGRSWQDRAPGGPRDTHELAVDLAAPHRLRSAAGDGYFESDDGGATWSSPEDGLEVNYLRSVALVPGDPDTVVVSASSRPRTAYVAGYSDGRVFRRAAGEPWSRITAGWPDPPATIAPLLAAGLRAGELWAADERGLHRSADGGAGWCRVAAFEPMPRNLRGLAVVAVD
jgi:photosystem II stability/assembly factor-like uncharacterized protein